MNLKLGMLAAALVAASAVPAQADSILLDASKIGESYSFNYNGYSDGTTIDGLSSTATFKLTGVSGNSYTFDYSVSNTSAAPVTGSRLSGFAFNTNPDIASATSTGAFSYTTLASNYPNGIGKVDVCFKDAQTGSCAGGANGGLTAGETGGGSFSLNFLQPVSSLSLSDFFVRYQSIEGVPGITSASGSGSLTSTSTGGTAVPEPGTLGMFAAAAFGLAFVRRRKAGASQPAPA